MSSTNTLQLGAEQAREAMLAIATAGWLTTAQVGAWIWPELAHDSARKRALKLVTRLVRKGYLLTRETPTGTRAYILTRSGSLECRRWLGDEVGRDGYDLSVHDLVRQEYAVRWLCAQRRSGKSAIGAAGIRHGQGQGLFDAEALRGADGVVLNSSTGDWSAAVVVRSAHSSVVRKVVRIGQYVEAVELVGESSTLKRFVRELKAYLKKTDSPEGKASGYTVQWRLHPID